MSNTSQRQSQLERETAAAERFQRKVTAKDKSVAFVQARLDDVIKTPRAPGTEVGLPDTKDFALGRAALKVEVAAWDIDVRPDGKGLPKGRGDVFTGEEVFSENCATCHGDFGEAVDRWPVLAGGHDTLAEEDPVKTIGSYWPYLSTVYDYVYRAMPFGNAQSLSHDDVYAITAYLLYVNDLVEDDFELSHENFGSISLPNEKNFYPDDRASTEYAAFTGEPCMSDCKQSVEITARARVIDVTPEEEGAAKQEVAALDTSETTSTQGLSEEATAPSQEVAEEPSTSDALDKLLAAEGDAEYGEYLSSECTACHMSTAQTSKIPSILGWKQDDFAIALHAYRVGERIHPVMQMIAGRLGDEEISALAAYFSKIQK
ncbi:MAG: c-type cytochrome [Rhizobiaceae bacterium]|nr:c-type cytochrome [Rhizobiaceae bacterium]